VAGIPVTRKSRKRRTAGTIQDTHPRGDAVATSATPHHVTHSKK